jgi:hypothetical protein
VGDRKGGVGAEDRDYLFIRTYKSYVYNTYNVRMYGFEVRGSVFTTIAYGYNKHLNKYAPIAYDCIQLASIFPLE